MYFGPSAAGRYFNDVLGSPSFCWDENFAGSQQPRWAGSVVSSRGFCCRASSVLTVVSVPTLSGKYSAHIVLTTC